MKKQNTHEQGQSLVLVALMLFVFFGMLLLVVDGGNGYATRRQAQNAADAGALAGAHAYCSNGLDEVQGEEVAINYAVTRNRADSAVVAFPGNKEIVVTATIVNDNFFGSLFGQQQMEVSATAASRCFTPSMGDGMIPMAFYCQEYVQGSESPDCGIKYDVMTMFGDSVATTDSCQPNGPMDCDLNDDGIRDVLNEESNRGWLNLDGGNSNTDELTSWILNGYNGPEIFAGLWLGGGGGVTSAVFDAAKQQEGKTVLVPIFDGSCNGIPTTTNYCLRPGDQVRVGNSPNLYYRIAGFAFFHITCVKRLGSDVCPFRDTVGYPSSNNIKSIEGYFVEGTARDLEPGEGGGVDMGVYIIRLSQ